MNAIRIRKTIESETLHLPELKPLVGRTVEIIVLDEDIRSMIRAGTGDWDAAERAVHEMEDYDYDALREQDDCDRLNAELQRRGAELSADPGAAMSWNEVQRLAEAELKELGKGSCR